MSVVTLVLGLFAAILVVIGLAMYLVYRAVGKPDQRDAGLLQTGFDANAKVLVLKPSGNSVAFGSDSNPGVQLEMEIHAAGRAPYQASITTPVSESKIPQIKVGQWIPVKVNLQRPQDFVLAGEFAQGTSRAAPWVSGPAKVASAVTLLIVLVVAIPLVTVFSVWTSIFDRIDSASDTSRSGTEPVAKDTEPTPPKDARESDATEAVAAPEGGYCKGAAACCEAASPKRRKTCSGIAKLPEPACKSAYKGYKNAAKAMGKDCP